ncbi:hypothetical protein [Microcoleus sp. CAWBG58]|uniref:hypothetical protein n=1 Tax=Microcoleus sp. CAWBG58 TaxID=2841651 RepID=UPI0025F0E885|nr:hypothetical protein [Microcoleus sp. CAWBG58]
MEFQSEQNLEEEIKKDAGEIVSEEYRLESYKKDLEAVQAALTLIKSRSGLYYQSDSKLIQELEAAKAESERNVESSKQKVREVIGRMRSKLNSLNQRIAATENRIGQMQQAANLLIPRYDQPMSSIHSTLETQICQQQNEVEDAKDKGNNIGTWIDNAESLVNNAGRIADIVDTGFNIYSGLADLMSNF